MGCNASMIFELPALGRLFLKGGKRHRGVRLPYLALNFLS